ncbi:sugar transporter sweet [Plakobranchus ocellatus]|uniref:Sugar transporter SWEET n=1 Tax=Plakobranchus ocellatus TaxID=259542 RepID=A0AAV4CD33_9GAST|nr:sugar transporter sweet [Plakobranchus ocellatus]
MSSLLLTIVEWSTVGMTLAMMASGLPGCLKMYRQRNASNAPYLLFIIFTVVSALSLQYALMIQNNALVLLNVVSVLVWSLYCAIYLLVCQDKSIAMLKLCGLAGLYSANVYYLRVIPASTVLPTLGKYLTVWCIVVYVLPLKDVLIMIRAKSNKSCDMAMLVSSMLSGAVWSFYGYLLNDSAIFIPSLVGVAVSGIKFYVYFLYGAEEPPKEVIHSKTVSNGYINAEFHKGLYGIRPRQDLKTKKIM